MLPARVGQRQVGEGDAAEVGSCRLEIVKAHPLHARLGDPQQRVGRPGGAEGAHERLGLPLGLLIFGVDGGPVDGFGGGHRVEPVFLTDRERAMALGLALGVPVLDQQFVTTTPGKAAI